jgi:hypothetical protein
MYFCYIALVMTLFSIRVLGKNSKINQYASIEDWYIRSTFLLLIFVYSQQLVKKNVNIISHASPMEYQCHAIDKKTKALYLVTGDGAWGAIYTGTLYGINRLDITLMLGEAVLC